MQILNDYIITLLTEPYKKMSLEKPAGTVFVLFWFFLQNLQRDWNMLEVVVVCHLQHNRNTKVAVYDSI